jgi:hypothetical protein
VVLVTLAGLGVCYLCLDASAEALGRDIKALELKREALCRHIVAEQARWSQMLAPASIDEALRRHGVVMTWPDHGQIVPMPVLGLADLLPETERPPVPRRMPVERVVMND